MTLVQSEYFNLPKVLSWLDEKLIIYYLYHVDFFKTQSLVTLLILGLSIIQIIDLFVKVSQTCQSRCKLIK